MIKAVLFDLDDTLLWDKKSIDHAFSAACSLFEEQYGMDGAELERAVRETARELYSGYDTYTFTQMIGINPFEGLWGEFLDDTEDFRKLRNIVGGYRKAAWKQGLLKMGIDDERLSERLAETFVEERKSNPFVYEDTYHILEELKGKYKLLLLTNGSPHLQNTKLSITPELIPFFDEIVISGDFGRGKPDPDIFTHALSLLGIDVEEALMVGDNPMTDILGANRAGIKSVWVNREKLPRKQVDPDYEVSSLMELIPLLKNLS